MSRFCECWINSGKDYCVMETSYEKQNLYTKQNSYKQENSYRYEAAILGNGLAALFAGYLLKKNRIRFVIVDTVNLNETPREIDEEFPFEISEEGKKLVCDTYRKIAAQVGISEQGNFGDTAGIPGDAGNEVVGYEEEKCLRMFLLSELKDEYQIKKSADDIKFDNGFVLIKCGNQTLEADVLIDRQDMLEAGNCAQAVMEEKQKRLEAYMKRLRIRKGKRTHRKMVYVTHSKSWFFAREVVMQFAVEQGAAAVNPFMNYGFYMNGTVEKDEVIECCHQQIRACDELWVFGPISEAILTDIAVAVMEGKEVHFFSISENRSEIHELQLDDIIFEREVHAGQIRKADLLDFVRSAAPRKQEYVQMSLFD